MSKFTPALGLLYPALKNMFKSGGVKTQSHHFFYSMFDHLTTQLTSFLHPSPLHPSPPAGSESSDCFILEKLVKREASENRSPDCRC